MANSDYSRYNIADSAEKNIQCVNALESERRSDFTLVSWYELLASLLYIYNNKKSWKVESDEDIFSTLIKSKPQYNHEQCQYAFDILNREGFVKEES